MGSGYLAKTPDNFRAEIARYGLTHKAVAHKARIHPTYLSSVLTGNMPMYDWAANNIGLAINVMVGLYLFETRSGLIRPTRGRPPRRERYPAAPSNPTVAQRRVPGGF